MKLTVILPLATALTLSPAQMALAQTYSVTDLGTLGTNASFATGINAAGQVSGYSSSGPTEARAWRYSPGTALVDLGSFGGTESRALSINDGGQITGYSTAADGTVHGFIFNGTDLLELGGPGRGTGLFPQHINRTGRIVGFASSTNGDETPFLFTPPNAISNLGLIANASLPATAAAYGLNDAGRTVGIGTGANGFNRAFRSTTAGVLEELGTLGGDESWAYAINNSNQVAGSATFISTDTHAFLFNEGAGMTDLGTLGGYTSAAFGLDDAGNAVGTAEVPNREPHAVLWPSGGSARDLNDFIPVNAGWTLTEARGLNSAGQIVGTGLHLGKVRAFLLTPNAGPDTNPPVALLVANNITNLQFGAQLFSIIFSDDTSVLASSIGSNVVRVTGPGGFDQLATRYGTPTTNGVKVTAQFYVTSPSPNQIWNGTNNGTYSVAIEPDTVSDTLGNSMPAESIGSFIVATETKPVASLAVPPSSPVTMATPATFTLTGLSSFPYAANDVLSFTIDWADGTETQTVNATNGTTLVHTYSAIGQFTARVQATDPHGITSPTGSTFVNVVNPAIPQSISPGPALGGSRRLAVGLNQNGTLLCLGGLPLKSGRDIVNSLAPGATAFIDAARLPAPTIGLGAGVDALNRVIVFGGIEPSSTRPNVNGFVYTTAGGSGTAIAPKSIAVHDFAFATDSAHRIYSLGGATGADNSSGTNGVERYDAAANAWTMRAPMPAARINATASDDGHGRIIVFGGRMPETGQETSTVFAYDIATDSWSQLSDMPLGGQAGRTAQLGADNLIYLIGGAGSTQIYAFDSIADAWLNGPTLSLTRSAPAVTLGNDGFIYVMGGDNPANGNNGLATTERFNTSSTNAPLIVSTPSFGTTIQALSTFSYKVIAFGNPRPALSLVEAPDGLNFNPVTGQIAWTPTTNQVGTHQVRVRASSSAGVAEQVFSVTVTPLPGDVTPPSVPESISLVFRSSTGVTLTWPAATDNVAVTSYNIYGLFRGSRSSHIGLMASGITNRSYITRGFANAYYVAAVDAAGNVSARSPQVGNGVLTLPVIGPVTFGPPPAVIQGNAFLYNLSVSANPSAGFSSFNGPAGMTFTHVPGPLTNADYVVVQWQPTAAQIGTNTFTVFATNLNTTGSSATFTVVVLPNGTDFIPPTPVAQLTASGIQSDRCQLSWTPAGDNIGIANYHLVATHFGTPSNHVVALDVPGSQTNTVLSGLLARAGYTVVITPSDAAGNVGGSTSIFLTTLAPTTVTLRVATGVTPGSLTLQWNSTGPSSAFTVESSDSLANANWQPIAPASQWPTAATNFVVAPTGSMKFFRVNARP